ncbi:SRPBCC family protein [Nocardioides carbamazepini]|uniref:SRPBCC family protein n=1 Tax=Nocardioides carbamazepini TaxID=2854259 RepID=UPI002149DB59|nr:SRPBCC family protein [Nocardioides carbamazepini]MCR1782674.1 SRPBCC family protein [Nocardioides carbamazepini]
MGTPIVVTEERSIAAPPAVVWTLATDPAHHQRLSPQCRLISATGEPGTPGSEAVDAIRMGPFRYRVRSRVAAARTGEEITTECWRGRRPAGVQRGEFLPYGDGVLLRWTVTLPDGGLFRRQVEGTCRANLVTWLAAIEREALTQELR